MLYILSACSGQDATNKKSKTNKNKRSFIPLACKLSISGFTGGVGMSFCGLLKKKTLIKTAISRVQTLAARYQSINITYCTNYAYYALPCGLIHFLLKQIHSEIVVQTHGVLCDAKIMHLRCLQLIVIHPQGTFGS